MHVESFVNKIKCFLLSLTRTGLTVHLNTGSTTNNVLYIPLYYIIIAIVMYLEIFTTGIFLLACHLHLNTYYHVVSLVSQPLLGNSLENNIPCCLNVFLLKSSISYNLKAVFPTVRTDNFVS